MLTRHVFMLCLLGSAACATDAYDGAQIGGRSVEKELCPTGCSDEVTRALASSEFFDEIGGNAFVTSPPTQIGFDDACNMLPSKGLCSLACDTAELGRRIPSGCITIACGLDDGRTVVAGACSNQFSTALTPY